MEKTIKIVLVVLLMMSMAEAKKDLENVVKEMRMEMKEMTMMEVTMGMMEMTMEMKEMKMEMTMEIKEMTMGMKEIKGRLALTEEELLRTKEELLRTKEEMLRTKEELKAQNVQLEKEVFTTKEDLLTTKEDLLTTKADQKSKDESIQDLDREVSFIKNPPFTFVCGAHSAGLTITSKTISYTKLLYSSIYLYDPLPEAGLDINTGIFTSGWPGTYTATWSLVAGDDHGRSGVIIYLRKNGERITESLHYSYYAGTSGAVADQGGRTLILHLDTGDTLDLYCDNCYATIYHTTFCVTMSQFDVV